MLEIENAVRIPYPLGELKTVEVLAKFEHDDILVHWQSSPTGKTDFCSYWVDWDREQRIMRLAFVEQKIEVLVAYLNNEISLRGLLTPEKGNPIILIDYDHEDNIVDCWAIQNGVWPTEYQGSDESFYTK